MWESTVSSVIAPPFCVMNIRHVAPTLGWWNVMTPRQRALRRWDQLAIVRIDALCLARHSPEGGDVARLFGVSR
jgi:hypothetical protein